MSKMENYWEPSAHPSHPVKYESDAPVVNFAYCNEPGLNFSTSGANYSEDDDSYASGRRGKTSRQDPLSHRIIEKRRRDRMNSCLADLSRLIPPQYMRKGRGRVEKTEIIEMAIKHLRNMQNQDCAKREPTCTEHYKIGYQDCLSEAAKFLLNERGEDLCYRMVTRLKEHCNEIMKGECNKMHSNDTNVSGSGGSPPPRMHYEAPMSQLRDILTSASDIEHSSNDHIDVKDLSFRTGGGANGTNGGSQAVSTSASSHENGDFETSRGSGVGHDSSDLELRLIRMRKFSETSSADLEHNNNNYKYKNYFKQRFSQDNHVDDKVGSSSGASSNCSTVEKSETAPKKRRLSVHGDLEVPEQPTSEKSRVNGGPLDMKIENLQTNGGASSTHSSSSSTTSHVNGRHPIHSFAVPIFACHTQGYYIPLNIDYEMLLPFLGTTDLLNKNFNQMPPLHPISINVNYAPLKPATFVKPKMESVANGW